MEAKQCQCGAVTVDGDGFTNSMTYKTFRKEFQGLRLPRKDKYYSCNHCVNHYGIDLCGCGSGEPVGKCQNNYDECKNSIPSQVKCEQREELLWRM